MQAAAAGTGVQLSDGSTNRLPVGDRLREGWELHHRLVTRALHRGFYQGWDLHPAQLPTRYAATFQFFRAGAPEAVDRLAAYVASRTDTAVADEPATARALADYLLRGLDCGALTEDEVATRPRRPGASGEAQHGRERADGHPARTEPVRQGGEPRRADLPRHRTPGRHEIRDLNVTTTLRGDFDDVHVTGDQAHGLPTDTQKNTAFAYAKLHGVSSPEDYALALATRLHDACTAAAEATVHVQEFAWDRVPVGEPGTTTRSYAAAQRSAPPR